jgi:hypothetical protein
MAVDFVCYVERAASSLGDGNFACLCGFEVPDGVLILRVLEQLVGCHGLGCHCQGSLLVLKRIPIRATGSCASTVQYTVDSATVRWDARTVDGARSESGCALRQS